MNRKTHWEDVYRSKQTSQVSWFQDRPTLSLDLIRAAALPATARIIDIGGGASQLVDHLLALGYAEMTVLDIAEVALDASRLRLGDRAASVAWLEADLLAPSTAHLFATLRPFDLWHDRAVFHFLIEPHDRAAYLALLNASLRPGGYAILATFALDGPEQCSNLPVARYSPDMLQRELGDAFLPLESRPEIHTTPAGRAQSFIYTLFRRAP